MKAVLTVIGDDRIGIISEISTILAKEKINILDVEQTIFENNFSMMMHVELPPEKDFKRIKDLLIEKQETLKLQINLYNDEIFKRMHTL